MTQVKKLVFLDPDAPCEDAIDALLNRLDTDDASDSDLVCRIHRNSENGNIAILPETAKSESEWESRALLMHSQQVGITVEPKPLENALAKVALERGD